MKSRRSRPAPSRRLAPLNDVRARLVGIGLFCAACFCFALLDTSGKWLNGHLPVLEVVWARYACHFLLSLLFVNPWTTPGLLSTRRPWLQIGRSTLLLLSTAFNFFALRYLQLDQTTSIIFATPFLVALLAGPTLGEWIGPRRWAAIIVGFIGVAIVTRPFTGGFHPAMILSLLAAICYALYSITTRILAAHDSTATTVFFSALVGTVISSIPLPFVWVTPSEPLVLSGMVAIGALGWIGHLFLIMAHRVAPAASLAPFVYTQLIWAMATGFLVFGDVPARVTLIGAGIVVLSGLYLIYRERTMKAEDSIKAQTVDEVSPARAEKPAEASSRG
jgi:drug/metabolite transporter (DMT)-like permease